MKKYQVITLALLLIFLFGLGNRTEEDMSDVTLRVHQALWHEATEGIDTDDLKELLIEHVTVIERGQSHTFSLKEFEDYFNERFPDGYDIYPFSRTTTQVGFWGNSSSEFGVGENVKGELNVNAWKFFSGWRVSKVEIAFDS